MKRTFTKQEILSSRGCYERERVLKLPFIESKRITLKNLFDGLPIKDFIWFLVRKCDLTLKQKKQFALHCAKQVLPIYEKRYPEDKRVRECIEATEGYILGTVSIDELREARSAAAAAYDAATAAAVDAYDAATAVYAAAAAAADAYAAADVAAADVAAAAAYDASAYDASASTAAYRKSIWEFCKTLN